LKLQGAIFRESSQKIDLTVEISTNYFLHSEHCVLQGKTVMLKIKTVGFKVHTRAQTISQHTNDAQKIYLVASRLLQSEIDNSAPKPLELRLIGQCLYQFATYFWPKK